MNYLQPLHSFGIVRIQQLSFGVLGEDGLPVGLVDDRAIGIVDETALLAGVPRVLRREEDVVPARLALSVVVRIVVSHPVAGIAHGVRASVGARMGLVETRTASGAYPARLHVAMGTVRARRTFTALGVPLGVASPDDAPAGSAAAAVGVAVVVSHSWPRFCHLENKREGKNYSFQRKTW